MYECSNYYSAFGILEFKFHNQTLHFKPEAYLHTDEQHQCNFMITTYRQGVDYPEDFNKVILGQQFLSHVYTKLDFESSQIEMGPKSQYVTLNTHDLLDSKDVVLMILLAISSLIMMMCFLKCIRNCCAQPPLSDGISSDKSKRLKFLNMNSDEKSRYMNSL